MAIRYFLLFLLSLALYSKIPDETTSDDFIASTPTPQNGHLMVDQYLLLLLVLPQFSPVDP